MKGIGRDKKGVSPVIATAILVLIAVVAGVLLWLWVSGFISASTAQQPALYERIKIEGVNVTTTTARVNVTAYVRNVGAAAVIIDAIYVLNASGVVVAQDTTVNVPISPGQVEEVSISVTTLTSGLSYAVKVVTKNGVEASYTFVAP